MSTMQYKKEKARQMALFKVAGLLDFTKKKIQISYRNVGNEKKHIKVGDTKVFYPEIIYARAMEL